MGRKFHIHLFFIGFSILGLNGILAPQAGGFQGAVDPLLFESSPYPSKQVPARTSFIQSFSKTTDHAFRRKMVDRQSLLSLYYQEKYTVVGLAPEMMTDAERRAEARILARQALGAVLKDTINEVNVIYNVREYGRSMTTANVKIEDGEMEIDGPSLENAGRTEEPSRRETLRSSVVLLNNADFGLSLRTILLGSFRSNLTYFLAGGDIFGASVTQDLGGHTDLKLEYRAATDENRVLATLTLPLGY